MRKMNFKKTLFSTGILIAASSAISSSAFAQSAVVYGMGNQIQSCYHAALIPSKTANSLKKCDQALANDMVNRKHRAHILVNRGILFQANGDFASAYDDYKSALKLDGDLPEAYANRGIIYYLMDRNDLALQDFDRALTGGIKSESRVRLNKAMALMDAGNAKSASAEYQQARLLAENKGTIDRKWIAFMAARRGA